MLGMSKTTIFQVLSEQERELQQHAYHSGRGNSWRCRKWNSQNQCILGESTGWSPDFHGGSTMYDTKLVCFYFD